MTGNALIIDLTAEQGPLRGTQVQPPAGAWAGFFALDFDDLPELTMHSRTDPAVGTHGRRVVAHHHVWTIEMPDAEDGHIALFERVGVDEYSYWIYSVGTAEHEHLDWLLGRFPNPLRRKGRRWLVV